MILVTLDIDEVLKFLLDSIELEKVTLMLLQVHPKNGFWNFEVLFKTDQVILTIPILHQKKLQQSNENNSILRN